MDFSQYDDKALVEMQRAIGMELITRAQVRRAADRAQLRMIPALV